MDHIQEPLTPYKGKKRSSIILAVTMQHFFLLQTGRVLLSKQKLQGPDA